MIKALDNEAGMKFILLSGSFHNNSRSLAILKNMEVFFGEHEAEVLKLDTLPFFSEDLTLYKPEPVREFLSRINTADGILICSPEYNHSIPAVLKNAIDWASRPAFNSILKDMPVSIITQAVSPVGGSRAQAHLKLVLDSTLSKMHMCHEMMIPQVHELFDNEMNLVNIKARERLEKHVTDFVEFTHKNRTYDLNVEQV
ncbi:MAG: NAD(P)H-dependent oxidoreductase [Pseudomonadales bacterium]|nr:NAD(P)H-dependent oxidoreductase [Pseudomonadales bacterium]